jgi:DNA-binding transcriptional LysR family regulator
LIGLSNHFNIIHHKTRLIMLDTDQLRSFIAIVDTGSFTRAAERVNKTQSAVSMHIRRLEEQLGRHLFHKQGRGVRLSEDGERLVEHARQMLKIEAAAFAAVSRKALVGRVRLGIPDDYAEMVLPDIMTRFSRRHPLVEISITCEMSPVLHERISANELDLAVVTECKDYGNIEVLSEQPLRWVTGTQSSVHELRPLPLALGMPNDGWRKAAINRLEERGVTGKSIPWKLVVASANQAAIAPVVAAGLAVTVLPQTAIRAGQRVLEIEDGLPALPMVRIGLLEGRMAKRSPEGKALADEIRAVFASQALRYAA